jgi:hypothetical protein
LTAIRVVLYREEGGSCPFLDWFEQLQAKAQDKCYLRLERLREMGHTLRRPEAELTCAIYELRASLGGVHYRILYFFKWGNRGSGLVRTCKGKGSPTEGD